MKLGIFEKLEIQGYFKIDQRIQNVKHRLNQLEDNFYEQNMATRISTDDIGIFTYGFPMERAVIDHVDSLAVKEKTLEALRKRQHFLNKYLNSLGSWEKEYLINRYSGRHPPKTANPSDVEIYKEILEIDDAINFMYGFPVDIRSETIDNNNLENQFNSIAETLGV